MRSPRKAGSVFSQLIKTSAATCRGHDQQKVKKLNESVGNVQKSMFSSILAAEVLKKAELALPRSMGIKKNVASHGAWGSHFQFFEHP